MFRYTVQDLLELNDKLAKMNYTQVKLNMKKVLEKYKLNMKQIVDKHPDCFSYGVLTNTVSLGYTYKPSFESCLKFSFVTGCDLTEIIRD